MTITANCLDRVVSVEAETAKVYKFSFKPQAIGMDYDKPLQVTAIVDNNDFVELYTAVVGYGVTEFAIGYYTDRTSQKEILAEIMDLIAFGEMDFSFVIEHAY